MRNCVVTSTTRYTLCIDRALQYNYIKVLYKQRNNCILHESKQCINKAHIHKQNLAVRLYIGLINELAHHVSERYGGFSKGTGK